MRSHSPFVGGSGEGSRHPDWRGVVEAVGGALGRQRTPPLRRSRRLRDALATRAGCDEAESDRLLLGHGFQRSGKGRSSKERQRRALNISCSFLAYIIFLASLLGIKNLEQECSLL